MGEPRTIGQSTGFLMLGPHCCMVGFYSFGHNLAEGLLWLRCATSVSALIPLHFFLVMEAVAGKFSSGFGLTRKSVVFWSIPSVVFLLIPFTDYFIPAHSTGEK